VTIEELQLIIRKLRDQGIGILITDHNVEATLNITDRNYILIDGEIVAEGTEAEIRGDAHVRKHYLGHGFDKIRGESASADDKPQEEEMRDWEPPDGQTGDEK